MEHRHPIRHGQRLALIVGDVHHGDAEAFVQVLDLHLHLLAQLLVQRAQGFVHQHQLRLEHQRPGEGNTLLLATRELRRIAIAETLQLDHRQRALDPLLDVRLGHAAHAERKRQVLRHGHVRKQRVVLEHHAHVALVRWHVVDRPAIEEDFPRRGRLEASQHHQAGGFARAGRPEQGEEFAAADVQIQIPDDQRLTVIALLDAAKAHQDIVRR